MLMLLLIFTTIKTSTNSELHALKQLGLYFQTRVCEKLRFPAAWTPEVGHDQGLHRSVCGFQGQLVYPTLAAEPRSQTVDLSLLPDAGEVAEAILCPPRKVKPQNKLPAVSLRVNPRE